MISIWFYTSFRSRNRGLSNPILHWHLSNSYTKHPIFTKFSTEFYHTLDTIFTKFEPIPTTFSYFKIQFTKYIQAGSNLTDSIWVHLKLDLSPEELKYYALSFNKHTFHCLFIETDHLAWIINNKSNIWSILWWSVPLISISIEL